METAILAGGCFWCIEAMYDDLQGIVSVESGYAGGHVDNPNYKQVCAGGTGHAESIRVTFDPAQISYAEILDIFFHVHDPTTLNRQGNDVGEHYRSAIFTLSPAQEAEAVAAKARAASLWPGKIVTQIAPAGTFWVAEDYHQEYFQRLGSGNAYCNFVVAPKVKKFREAYKHRLKSAAA